MAVIMAAKHRCVGQKRLNRPPLCHQQRRWLAADPASSLAAKSCGTKRWRRCLGPRRCPHPAATSRLWRSRCPSEYLLLEVNEEKKRKEKKAIGYIHESSFESSRPRTQANYLKPIAEEERRIEAEEKKKREELERIAKELAEASEDSILK
nr:PREDICTED: ATP synthase subunit e, mitochondrial [Opisthocomus hoazin]